MTSTGAIPNVKLTEAVGQEKIEDNVHQQYDGMPSFDEWKKMMLAEQEKGGNFFIFFSYKISLFCNKAYCNSKCS